MELVDASFGSLLCVSLLLDLEATINNGHKCIAAKKQLKRLNLHVSSLIMRLFA